MAVGVAADAMPCFRERENCIAPVSRHIRQLVYEAHRGRGKGGRELQRVENRNGVLKLIGITVVEGQQRGGAGRQRSGVEPSRELGQGKHGVPTLRESGLLVGKSPTASNPVIAEDDN